MREAPSRVVIGELLASGASVRLFDPVALEEARACLTADLSAHALSRVTYCSTQNDAIKDADALVIVTEWKSFRSLDFAAVRAVLKQAVIFDGRNLFEPARMQEAGFEYFAIGRSAEGLTIA